MAQASYAKHYNSRAKDKHFEIGDQVVVLTADSTNKLYARWIGPCNIVEVRAPYSYLIELPDSSVRHVHANRIRPWVTRVNMVGIIKEDDDDFGDVRYAPTDPVVDDLPSAKIDPDMLGHLTSDQRADLLQLLDRYASCFSERPGFCNLVEHKIDVNSDFKPKKFKAYKIPEVLKARS